MPRLRLLLRLLFYGPAGLILLGCLLLVWTAQPRAADAPVAADPDLSARLGAHVRALDGPRNRSHAAAYDRARAYLQGALAASGYPVQRDGADNLIARSGAPEARPVVLGAHYDSASYAPGADDNASGVAAVLEVARALAGQDLPVEFHLYADEEPPCFQTACMGSLTAAREATEAGRAPRAILVLDAVGYFSDEPGSQRWPLGLPGLPTVGNFIAVVADPGSARLGRAVAARLRATSAVPISMGVVPGWISGAEWSDHWSWHRYGHAAVMLTDTAVFRNPHYHEISDAPATLDLRRLAAFTAALAATVADLAREG